MKNNPSDIMRKLPSMDALLRFQRVVELIDRHSRPLIVSSLRKATAQIREKIKENPAKWADMDQSSLADAAIDLAEGFTRPDLRRVINATGVVVHTNLGRAPLAADAVEAVVRAAEGYSNLEYDLDAGLRGSRQSLVESKLRELTGAEAAIAVNNNAGAVMLMLMALCSKKQAVVSRGELVEIGGSFRIPDIMKASGAIMVEVGTTNRTHLKDYRNAIGDKTAALLKIHKSNFYLGGFTKEASVEELAKLANEHGVALLVDLGSGAIIDTASMGLPHEPTAMETLKQGAHVVTMSGDKLLGGPQAGIIAGRKDLVMKMKNHPVHRALRPDKMTLAALETTLTLYIKGESEKIPVVAMLGAKPALVNKKAKMIAEAIKSRLAAKAVKNIEILVEKSVARVGGGAMAEAEIPSYAVIIKGVGLNPGALMEKLRDGQTPIIGRVEKDKAILDARTLLYEDPSILAELVLSALIV